MNDLMAEETCNEYIKIIDAHLKDNSFTDWEHTPVKIQKIHPMYRIYTVHYTNNTEQAQFSGMKVEIVFIINQIYGSISTYGTEINASITKKQDLIHFYG